MHARKKTACIVIVIILLLSEVYLDTVMTDSFFVYNSIEESNFMNFIFGRSFLKNDGYICTIKMINEYTGIELQSAGWNLFLCLLYLGYIFLLQGRLFQLSEMIQTFYQTLDALVTEYMHQSDGKKRIEPNIFWFCT